MRAAVRHQGSGRERSATGSRCSARNGAYLTVAGCGRWAIATRTEMADKARGPTCQECYRVQISDGTSALTPTPAPSRSRGPEDVSYEIGVCYMAVETRLTVDPAEMQVIGR